MIAQINRKKILNFNYNSDKNTSGIYEGIKWVLESENSENYTFIFSDRNGKKYRKKTYLKRNDNLKVDLIAKIIIEYEMVKEILHKGKPFIPIHYK